MPNLRPLSTRSFNLQSLSVSLQATSSLNRRSFATTRHVASGDRPADLAGKVEHRQIGKVPRPARPTPLTLTGPPRRRTPRPLPPSMPSNEVNQFLATIPGIRNRPTLINDECCRDLVRAWGVDKLGNNVTVVDTYGGAGGLTKAFLELPNVKRVITIEDAFRYNGILRKMHEEEEAKNPGRMRLVEMDSFTWESYSKAGEYLDLVPTIPWEQGPNDHLFLSGQLPNNRHGEQLFVQLVTAIANKMWYFTKGRFSMGFVGAESYFKKILAQPGEPAHHKLSVLFPSIAHIRYVETFSDFRPVYTHFHKPRMDPAHVKAVKVTPREQPLVQSYEALDYVAKHMFVGKAVPWPKAIAAITPGSANLIPKLIEQGLTDLDKAVNKLTLEEWVKIADTFEDWPFRPAQLMDIWGSDDSDR